MHTMDYFNKAVASIDPAFAAQAKKGKEDSNGQRTTSGLTYQHKESRQNESSTKKNEQELLQEVKTLNEEVTSARKALWETQDMLEEKESQVVEMKHHVDDLLQKRVEDDRAIHMLKDENTKLVEGELKIRESLDLMKTVFTRSQLKTKEDQDTIARLRTERDSLRKELKTVLKNRENDGRDDDPAKGLKHIHAAAAATLADMGMSPKTSEKERNLKKLLRQTEHELESLKKEHELAQITIKRLNQQLSESQDSAEANRQLGKQRRIINRLEQQIMDMELDDAEREDREHQDAIRKDGYSEVLGRACLDEDLEGSLTRQVMAKLDCSSSFGQ